jgi:hypothetical protein
MTRPIRIEFSGALYHVTSRGDRREAIFEDDAHRSRFLEVLGIVAGSDTLLSVKPGHRDIGLKWVS